jgi:hypothetical protein
MQPTPPASDSLVKPQRPRRSPKVPEDSQKLLINSAPVSPSSPTSGIQPRPEQIPPISESQLETPIAATSDRRAARKSRAKTPLKDIDTSPDRQIAESVELKKLTSQSNSEPSTPVQLPPSSSNTTNKIDSLETEPSPRKEVSAAAGTARIRRPRQQPPASPSSNVESPKAAPTLQNEAHVVEQQPDRCTISITVHRTDLLDFSNGYLFNPFVRITAVDLRTGQPIKPPNNIASGFQLTTSTFNLRRFKTLSPQWHETVSFDFPMELIYTNESLFLFEVIDTGSGRVKSEKNIAWAFLRTISSSLKRPNIGHARLQLYEYVQTKNSAADKTSKAYQCWKQFRKPYNSTIYVTVEKKLIVDKNKMASKEEARMKSRQVSYLLDLLG